uniref:Uncharacterized protein n=1 Tax=Haptolina brevifila TaxID=156173 RepID=A0A7S2IA54_9EUKA|mmetsp:Transcript_63376/g.125307  ORF Transcript_63376/g.125307 Transcript_63376/m.125307 type:complete len:366 (+) Transcript_63376:530-1627(+)
MQAKVDAAVKDGLEAMELLKRTSRHELVEVTIEELQAALKPTGIFKSKWDAKHTLAEAEELLQTMREAAAKREQASSHLASVVAQVQQILTHVHDIEQKDLMVQSSDLAKAIEEAYLAFADNAVCEEARQVLLHASNVHDHRAALIRELKAELGQLKKTTTKQLINRGAPPKLTKAIESCVDKHVPLHIVRDAQAKLKHAMSFAGFSVATEKVSVALKDLKITTDLTLLRAAVEELPPAIEAARSSGMDVAQALELLAQAQSAISNHQKSADGLTAAVAAVNKERNPDFSKQTKPKPAEAARLKERLNRVVMALDLAVNQAIHYSAPREIVTKARTLLTDARSEARFYEYAEQGIETREIPAGWG